jgi:hypothetical protein
LGASVLTGLPAITTNLVENGHPGFIVVTSRAGIAVGATVDLHSTATDALGLKVKSLVGTKVYLWDPSTQSDFDASAFLLADTAYLQQAAQDVFGGILRDSILDPEEDGLPLSTAEMAALLTAILPGGAGAASNVTVINFPPQQHVVVDNTVTFTPGNSQNSGTLTAATQTVALPLGGRGGTGIVITGVWSGTIAFEASIDAGVTWFAIETYRPETTNESVTSTTTVNGNFQPLTLAGVTHVRVRASAWTSGTASIVLSATGSQAERLAPNVRENGSPGATYGAMAAGLDGGGLTKFLKVTTDGAIVLDSTGFTDGSQKTQVTNFPATQPISAVALPLPAGAAVAAAQTDGSQLTQVVQGGNTLGIDASGRITVNINGTVPISGNVGILGTVPVSGTFFQATQPISAVALPLPAGAATSANQTNGSQLAQVVGNAVVDPNNSTTTPLAGGATFTGAATDLDGYASVTYSMASDVVSAVLGVICQFSPDGVNWDDRTFNQLAADRIGANKASDFAVRAHDRFFRIKYTNGASPQSYFRFQTILQKQPVLGDTVGIAHVPTSGLDAALTKSILTGKQPLSEGNSYADVSVDNRGALFTTEAGTHATFGGVLAVNEIASSVFKAAYGINARTCNQVVANGGSIDWSSARARLQTSAAANGSAKLGTREAVRYVPGQGNIARFAPVFNPGTASSRQAVGFLTDTDGFAFGFNGTSFGILIRNDSVDTWIPQASWNGDDKFLGSGPNGEILDPTKGSPMQIQMQWLGFGAVRWFIEDSTTGDFVLVHTLKFANTSAVPSIQQPSLPVRFEVVNIGNTSNLTAYIASMGGYAEGVREIPGEDVRFSFSNAVTGVPTTGARVFTVRNKATNIFGGTKVNAINVHIDHLAIRAAATGDMFIQLVLNPTLTGASFTDIGTSTSTMQSDVASTYTAASGTVLMTVPVTSNTSTTEVLRDFDIRLAPGDVLGVIAFSETGTVNTRASLSWHEEN